MTLYLIAAIRRDDLGELRRERQLWRRVRRFNLPVQLAVAAAEDAAAAAADPAALALVSLAPCRTGSPELTRAILEIDSRRRDGRLGTPPINPTLTFHAVDNLALSSLAITFGNHAWGLGLGSAAGQAWVALEVAMERLADGAEDEALVVAGDQDEAGEAGLGVALLFARRKAPWPATGRPLRLAAVERRPAGAEQVEPHAAAGLDRLVEELVQQDAGSFAYNVPAAAGDGRDRVRLSWEVG